MSQKYGLFADRAGQLQQRGMSRRSSLLLVASRTAVPLDGEWLEAFYCEQCQGTKWYHVHKLVNTAASQSACTYKLALAPQELWQQVTGVISPNGNPSVGEFTLRQARLRGNKGLKDFQSVS